MTHKLLSASLALIALATLGATDANAQPSDASTASSADPAVEHVIIDGDLLEGRGMNPHDIVVVRPRTEGFGPQAKLKRSFGRELQESLHDGALHE